MQNPGDLVTALQPSNPQDLRNILFTKDQIIKPNLLSSSQFCTTSTTLAGKRIVEHLTDRFH